MSSSARSEIVSGNFETVQSDPYVQLNSAREYTPIFTNRIDSKYIILLTITGLVYLQLACGGVDTSSDTTTTTTEEVESEPVDAGNTNSGEQGSQ